VSATRPIPSSVEWSIHGDITPLLKARQGQDWTPTRPLGGWLIPYGTVGLGQPGVTPIRDRDDQLFEAAATIGMIDFSDYLKKGRWNDTHRKRSEDGPKVIVGAPRDLEFHGPESELAKAHGKVGFWTEGFLFDRADPRSWLQIGHTPTSQELDRADYFWKLANLLKGTPRQIGLSAEGKMLSSPCGKRIIWAKVTDSAVCDVPVNPFATVQPLQLARPIRREMLTASPCDDCRCPPGARCQVRDLSKGVVSDSMSAIAPQDLERDANDERKAEPDELKAKIRRLAELLALRTGCTVPEALALIKAWRKAETPTPSSEG
jgi:hypothetical protein